MLFRAVRETLLQVAATLDLPTPLETEQLFLCPNCGEGPLRVVARVPRPSVSELVATTYWTEYLDTS